MLKNNPYICNLKSKEEELEDVDEFGCVDNCPDSTGL